jgi:hypothetical protein
VAASSYGVATTATRSQNLPCSPVDLLPVISRASRNLAFVVTLMDVGVDFAAVDYPHANKLTIHILASIAEHEQNVPSRL